jgi:hypothetical protein
MFDPNKPVQTRDGRKARIICTDAKANENIIALLQNSHGEEYVQHYLSGGTVFCTAESGNDLINIEEGEG